MFSVTPIVWHLSKCDTVRQVCDRNLYCGLRSQTHLISKIGPLMIDAIHSMRCSGLHKQLFVCSTANKVYMQNSARIYVNTLWNNCATGKRPENSATLFVFITVSFLRWLFSALCCICVETVCKYVQPYNSILSINENTIYFCFNYST